MSEPAGNKLAEPLPSATSEGRAANGERRNRTCWTCGAIEEPGKKLLRCSGCLSVCFCNAICQKSAWKQHKPDCIRCKKVDIYAASPLLAAVAFLPRMPIPIKMLSYEVYRRELRGRELHLYLRNQGRMRVSPADFDKSGPIPEGPSREQLHNMVQHDGYLEATVVGSLYGFHCAVQHYNNRGGGHAAQQNALDYVTLIHRKAKITEYGIAVGSTCPDYTLVYHIGDKFRSPPSATFSPAIPPHGRGIVCQPRTISTFAHFHSRRELMSMRAPSSARRQLSDVVRMYVVMYIVMRLQKAAQTPVQWSAERSDRLYLDVGSLPYGMGLMLNIIHYLPDRTPESQIRSFTPTLGAPGLVMDLSDLAAMERIQAGSVESLKKNYLADRHRIAVSGAPVDEDPEKAIRGLLQQLQHAVAARPSAAAKTTAVMGMVAAAAVVTAAAVAVPTEAKGGGGGGGSPSRIRGGGGNPAVRGGSPGGSNSRRIPFRDSTLDKHVKRAMLHFECAFNNTYAVLDQRSKLRLLGQSAGYGAGTRTQGEHALQHSSAQAGCTIWRWGFPPWVGPCNTWRPCPAHVSEGNACCSAAANRIRVGVYVCSQPVAWGKGPSPVRDVSLV
ncbi:hypothetical protein VOLCADRAFT_106759 [Volvox carteri f. nagariensis]|uniref:MYND-type domain-containing protein n=1 Tax=Volvox carteri f. nagariensis TaxID=3068 RepID=D8U9K0_VOLCA|nr:uncharacterized protein VOLCADRAFT_106759 [Volvox carteri f. nagariensis]EFJ43655.1 hypothetical protein VOLCADRAFT_106759 [Volvox carteri f. nagariensis]|eukprot:XP_002955355.1 hypothetical protein VOLCADRAFT_106759 [Volvox carteri f. nagariensis]